MRRDSPSIQSNDQFGVFLDTYYDRRNSVGFFVNPLGGFSDLQITNEADPNTDWNPIAQIRTGRFDGGWTVEMAIPFRSLRYRAGRDQVWGIQMRRFIVRKNELSHLTALPASVVRNGAQGAIRVSMYGTLVGIEPPPPTRNLEVKPYVISGLETDLTADPQISNDGYADAGLDVKYGITENLTADLTFNTDFAQVEVDEQQVNLTRFNLFFPEKREFFLESQGIFEFGNGGRGAGGGGGGRPGSGSVNSSGRGRGGRSVSVPTLFYSRQIGLQDGEPVPIFAGGRVTGKVGSFDVGAVGIWTDDVPAVGAEATTFTVLRIRRDVFARSSVGVLFEDRSPSALAMGGPTRRTESTPTSLSWRTLRPSATTRKPEPTDSRVRMKAIGPGSVIEETCGVRPWITFWSAPTSTPRSDSFAGLISARPPCSGRFGPRLASVPSIRRLTFVGALGFIENERLGFLESRSRMGRFEVEFENSDWLTVNFTDIFERLGEDTSISGAVIPTGRYSFRDVELSYFFGPHRRASGNASLTRGSFYSGDVTSVGITGGRVEVLPQLSVEPSIELNWIDLPELQASSGQFNQHVARTRITYSLSPRSFLSGLV